MKWFCSMIAVGLLCTTTHAQVPGQPYQVPAGYEGYSAGTLINYGGANYVIQGNGTMLLAAQGSMDDSGQATQAYQVPAGYEGYSAGTLINYGGTNYQIQDNGTMVLTDAAQATAGNSGGPQATAGGYTAVDNTQYQTPAGYGGYSAGSVVNYGGSDYMISDGGVMIRVNMGVGPRPNYITGAGTLPNNGFRPNGFQPNNGFRPNNGFQPNNGGFQPNNGGFQPNGGGSRPNGNGGAGGGSRPNGSRMGGLPSGGLHPPSSSGHMGGLPSGGIHLPSGGLHLPGGRL